LYGLRNIIPNFRACLNIILDVADSHNIDHESIDQQAMDLYGLIHARYILTKRGMERMLRKYRIGEFGVCPVMECAGQPVLPVGLRDQLRYHEVMVYCARCNSVFYPAQKQQNYREENLDGAYFGSTFAHLLLMQYPALRPSSRRPTPGYVPRVFGFRVRSQNAPPPRSVDALEADYKKQKLSNDAGAVAPSTSGSQVAAPHAASRIKLGTA
jgi:casein kinase II subunit beta